MGERGGLTVSGSLKEIEARCHACCACGLRAKCRQVVFGDGDPEAAVMFVGEAPGAEEDRQGRPFVGPAGKLLDRLLAYAGFSPAKVHITNVVKCRPPGNRFPSPQEAAACRPYLVEQIKLVRPKIIVCLGALAAQALVHPAVRITKVRGRWFEMCRVHYAEDNLLADSRWRGAAGVVLRRGRGPGPRNVLVRTLDGGLVVAPWGNVKSIARVLATFHPAAVLRDRAKLRPVAEDFRKLAAARRALEEARKRRSARAAQLSLDFLGGSG